MKMRDNEIRVVQMNVCGERGEEKTDKATHGEESDEAQGVKHRGVIGNGTLVESCRPIKDLDR